jgi:hypothetical protein
VRVFYPCFYSSDTVTYSGMMHNKQSDDDEGLSDGGRFSPGAIPSDVNAYMIYCVWGVLTLFLVVLAYFFVKFPLYVLLVGLTLRYACVRVCVCFA